LSNQHKVLIVRLSALEGSAPLRARPGDRRMEFHLSRTARSALDFGSSLYASTGNIIFPDPAAARVFAQRVNERIDSSSLPEGSMKAGQLNAMALIDEILHYVSRLYREHVDAAAFQKALSAMTRACGETGVERLLLQFTRDFPPLWVYQGRMDAVGWINSATESEYSEVLVQNRELAAEELLLLKIANENPAFEPFRFFFDDGIRPLGIEGLRRFSGALARETVYVDALAALDACLAALPPFGPEKQSLPDLLRAPMRASPYSLAGQLEYMRQHWGLILGDRFERLLGGLDLIHEEERPRFSGPGPTQVPAYHSMPNEYERFSADADWMPNVVMMAKSTLVWLDQLSKTYGRDIHTLDAIPDEELDSLASRGFNALWLIGIWQRSAASAEIKRRCGNPEAAASAYALFDYEIADELGGWPALENLKGRCSARGIRLAADMVPNHTGLDSRWIRERPGLFMSSRRCPYPGYSFNGGDLSQDPSIGLWIEDHYYDRTDAAVVFKRLDRRTGQVDYIYHGNDGTSMPWNDTAQIDFLKPEAREAVTERILHVARNFPIIRFDAAMVLAKKSFRRLWYPAPGSGGDIPSRSEHAMSDCDFDKAMPDEFWRGVVDRCAKEAPDTLLLAEAFWMMEGYFVRTLGMHRVYNSAFMNMLKKEENQKYRETIKNTIAFDKDILKRFVNFMNNPDEETAVAQFGSGDKYFGVCTMMATMPGLPMFGHGQLEGFTEKYGMEYRRAYKDEKPDRALLERHEREIFPLLKRRPLFSGVSDFLFYDLVQSGGGVNENVFAYSNSACGQKALVLYNNAYERAEGHIRDSVPYAEKQADGRKATLSRSLADALGLSGGDGRFVVMREQKSGLWYLRRSQKLIEEGLTIILNGYEAQVFIDIFEVADGERQLYSLLYDALAGAGVPDLGAALQDMALRELYSALSRLAAPSYFRGLRSLIGWEPGAETQAQKGQSAAARKALAAAGRAERDAAIEEYLGSVRGPALDFYSVIYQHNEKAAAAEAVAAEKRRKSIMPKDPEKNGTAGGRERLSKAAAAGTAAAAEGSEEADRAEQAAARLEAGLRNLIALPGLIRGTPGRGKSVEAKSGAGTRLRGAEEAFLARLSAPGAVEAMAVYLILDGLKGLLDSRASSEESILISQRFGLARKLRDALKSEGLPEGDAYRFPTLAETALGRGEAASLTLGKADPGDPEAIQRAAMILADDEAVRAAIGCNVYEGVEWFNKELFESTVSFIALTGALQGSSAHPKASAAKKRGAVMASELFAEQLLEAEKLSNYRFQDLQMALTGTGSMRGDGSVPERR